MRRALGCTLLALLVACSGEVRDAGGPGDAGENDSAMGASGGAGGTGGGNGGQDAATATSEPKVGEPGCGFDHAAFCDTFDAPSAHRGRAGELDARLWSAGHVQPSLPTSPGFTFGILPATLPACRADLPAQVYPGQDALICDPVPEVASPHLLVACGAQNYGATSLRIRQPFDFADRTGTVAFDADGFVVNPLLGWIAVSVTEDPMAVPSYAILGNDEGGVVPRNGFEVHFARNCPDGLSMGVRMIAIYDERQETIVPFPDDATCIPVKEGHLNRFEIRVSQSRIEVHTSPNSEDGSSFAPLQLMIAADVDLPFTRGYVNLAVHNHATIKYSGAGGYSDKVYDAWVARWDNVGFDGPVIDTYREYGIPDATEMHEGTLNIGYRIADVMDGPSRVLRFEDVDLTGVVSARIAQTSYYLLDGVHADYLLRYRLNGHPWHDRPLNADELHAFTHKSQGALAQVLAVPSDELQAGDNTLEYVTENVPQSYPPAALNIDLVLATD
jgi:hypothetical protein